MPDGALDALDRKEGAGFAYRRVDLEVELEGESRRAIAYEVERKEPQEVAPTADYLRLLVAGAAERGLPHEYVEAIGSR